MEVFEKAPSVAAILPHAKPDNKHQLSDGHTTWSFPVGLAAGFDKNARAVDFLSRLGFGAVEVGTITPLPQEGNPRPRIQRFSREESLLNSMGFPNEGMEKIYQRLAHSVRKERCALGANLGKNKDTSERNAAQDYACLYQKFAPMADYLVINVSSPNTPGLRALQSKEGLRAICEAVSEKRRENTKPLYVKIAPELEQRDLRDLVELAKEFNLSGIIATNTSVSHKRGKGGLSGKAISLQAKQARDLVLEMTRETPNISVIGAGGISAFDDILDFWRKGGGFVQIYTSFIFQGPGILAKFQKDLDTFLKREGASTLQEWMDARG